MNDVIISAMVKGDFEPVSNDGVRFTLVSRGSGNQVDEFTALAYGYSANFLQHKANSGDRLVAQGRISSEKLDGENYEPAITVSRVLSVCKAEDGIDYNRAMVDGLATCNGTRVVGAKETTLAGFNIANKRLYVNQSGEQKTYSTYINATLWGDRAKSLEEEGLIPTKDTPVAVEGILKPRTYVNNEGREVNVLDIWIDDIVFVQAQSSPTPRKSRAPAKAKTNTSKMVDADSSPF